MTVFVSNTNVIELQGLENSLTGAFINDAVVTCTIKDSAGANVAGISWPLTLDYVASSDGVYRALLSSSASFVANNSYRAIIDADPGTSRAYHKQYTFVARHRI